MSKKISKKKCYLLRLFQIVSAVLPLVVLVLIRHDEYIYSVGSAVRFSIGGIIALVVMIVALIGKLHLKGLGWSVIGFALSYFLQDIINDLIWIFLCLTIGMVMSKVFEALYTNEKDKYTIDKTAEMTTKQMETVVKMYHESGRV